MMRTKLRNLIVLLSALALTAIGFVYAQPASATNFYSVHTRQITVSPSQDTCFVDNNGVKDCTEAGTVTIKTIYTERFDGTNHFYHMGNDLNPHLGPACGSGGNEYVVIQNNTDGDIDPYLERWQKLKQGGVGWDILHDANEQAFLVTNVIPWKHLVGGVWTN